MEPSQRPQTSSGTNEIPTVSLPPVPQMPEKGATTFLRLCRWLDTLLVVWVLLFAFLVVSFPASNTDFFRHLALGRMLLQGQYRFGVDPFVYTDDASFVNHSWLFDLLSYGLYHLSAEGVAAVLFKAIVITVLAAILLCASRPVGQSLWIPSGCTALAVLAASSRLAFSVQPLCLSCLFLGLTIFIIFGEKKWLWWLLPLLFALWVNCDAWFFLGPLTVALYLVGEWLRTRLASVPVDHLSSANRGEWTKIGAVGWLVLFLGMAACLVNPHHFRAWMLPPELGLAEADDLLVHDPQFHSLFLSPLGKDYYKPYFGLSVAGLAYWPLMLLSLASFVFVFKRMPWPRLLVWVGLAGMSLYNWRTIPFFAIVAGPITALNGLDFVVRYFGPTPRLNLAWPNWSLGGRVMTLLFALVLLLATVPGWLQKAQPSFHRIGWSVRVDSSLQAMAETIHGWRQAGLLPQEPHWFNMYPEIANYLAWFAPGERIFLDQNLPHLRKTAEDYLTVRQGLEQEMEHELAALKTDWQKVLRDHQVQYWIFDNLGTQADVAALSKILFARPQEWVLCHLKGRIAIFAWRDPRRPDSDPSTGLALDLKSLAFGPNADLAPPYGVEPAPPRDWWHACWAMWWRPDPPLSSDRESIAFYDYHYQAVERPQQIYLYSRIWWGTIAAEVIANSLLHGPMPNSLLSLSWSCTYKDIFNQETAQLKRQPRPSEGPAMQAWLNYVNSQFLQPPSLYLAVRAARRALLAYPEDEAAYFRLGQVYQRLRELPQESQLRKLPRQMAPLWLDAIRRTQMAVAFQNCLRLQPDDDKAAQAHEALFWLYRDLGYIDAAVYHLRQARDKRAAAGPLPGMSQTQHNQMLDQMAAELARWENELDRRRNRNEVNAASKSGLEKVQVALQEGLSETALTILEQEPDVNISKPTEVALVKTVTGVALDLGRLDKAQQLLPDLEGKPANPEDLELYVRLAAARGDYAEADRLLDEALRSTRQPTAERPPTSDPTFAAVQAIGRVLLAEALAATSMPRVPLPHPLLMSHFWVRRWRLDALFNSLLAIQQRAQRYSMRGWLALEAGRCVEARTYFQAVRDITVPVTHWASESDQLDAWLDPQQEISGMQQLGFHHAVLHDLSTHYLRWLGEK